MEQKLDQLVTVQDISVFSEIKAVPDTFIKLSGP